MPSGNIQILLVLGNIRTEQYEPVINELEKQGIEKPQIVRVSTRLATDRDFMDEVDGLGIPPEARSGAAYEQYHAAKTAQLQKQIIDACFAGWRVSDVVAVIRHDSSDHIGVGHMAWLLEQVSPLAHDYIVMNGQDGTQYIMGRFGTLEMS